MTYFGPISKNDGDCAVLLDYFAKLGKHIKPKQNPAEFILEVTGAGIPSPSKQNDSRNDKGEANELVPARFLLVPRDLL